MSSGFTFNPQALTGVEPQLRAGLNKYLRGREREINAVEHTALACHGGPFAGSTIALEAGQRHSTTFTVGKWSGRYEVVGDLFGGRSHVEWRPS